MEAWKNKRSANARSRVSHVAIAQIFRWSKSELLNQHFNLVVFQCAVPEITSSVLPNESKIPILQISLPSEPDNCQWAVSQRIHRGLSRYAFACSMVAFNFAPAVNQTTPGVLLSISSVQSFDLARFLTDYLTETRIGRVRRFQRRSPDGCEM